MNLNANTVNEVFQSCIFQYGEAISSYNVGYGVKITVNFHPGRIITHTGLVEKMLSELPDSFKRSGGGGMSFLNMCEDRDGNLWTGDHYIVDQLVCLGSAIGKISFPMPREMWAILPGGMPYILIQD